MGSELLGLGPRNIAVKDTAAWRRMSSDEKLSFWRERMERVSPGTDAMEIADTFARTVKYGGLTPADDSEESLEPLTFRGRLGCSSYATFFR